MPTRKLSYREKFLVMDREALATFCCALLITLFFWAAIFCFGDSELSLLSFPLWFVLSCLCGYLLSIVGVVILIKRYFVNFDLDEDAKEEQHDVQ